MRSCAALLVLFVSPLLHPITTAAESPVRMDTGDDHTLTIHIGDQEFATYNFGPDLPKPFLLPVRSASGTVMTRALQDPADPDHPHHKGVWISVDEVNGTRFWNEDGRIVNLSVRPLTTAGDAASFEVVNHWALRDTGAVQLTETTVVTVFPDRLLCYDILLTASHGPVVFGDTKEGLLGFRVAPSMKEKNGGSIISSDGTRGTAECWGRAYDWIDYSGDSEGHVVGVALMDHPGNLRPSRYHVRDYGLFSINPFGERAYTDGANEAAPVHLDPGQSLRLRYGVYLHEGDEASGGVAAAYSRFLDHTR